MNLITKVYQMPQKWNYAVGGHGYGNNEAQFYTKKID